ncbi:hypothetical protein [Nocardia rhizosphaerihabitans]|nr:hypothetical protein [Nocardia rhizosphaerihabitans]
MIIGTMVSLVGLDEVDSSRRILQRRIGVRDPSRTAEETHQLMQSWPN